MNRRTMIAILTSLLSIGALAATASAASWHWDIGWGTVVGAAATGDCYAPVSVVGHSVINGNDAGQVIAYCADTVNNVWDCGDVHGTDVGVRAAGLPSGSSTWEYTNGTSGASVGSAAGGVAIAQHACQMGYWY
jgi:hypothetical protein